MGVAVRIFLRDLKRIMTNPVAIIVTIGVCIIPSLYAWVNILANWDPYESTSTVPVAVVIEDTGDDVPGVGYTNAGSMVHDRLQDDTQLGWNFVDKDTALIGVQSGTYYAAFVIPADFTHSLSDVLDGDTNQAHIAYYVNEKANAISPKVSDTASSTLETQISDEFVRVVSKTVSEKLQTSIQSTTQNLDTTKNNVSTSLREVSTTLSQLADSLGTSQTTIDSTHNAITSSRSTLSDIRSAATSLSGSLSETLDATHTTRGKAQTLSAQLNASLGTSSATITGVSSNANYDIGKISGTIGWATGKLHGTVTQLKGLKDTTDSLKSSLQSTRDSLAAVQTSDAVTEALRQKALQKIDAQLSLLQQLSTDQLAHIDRLTQLADSIDQGNDAVRTLSDSVNTSIQSSSQTLADLQSSLATTTMPQLSSSFDSFSNAGGKLAGTAGSLAPLLDQADATLVQLDSTLTQGSTAVSQTATVVRDAADSLQKLAKDTDAVQSAETLDSIKDILNLNPEELSKFMGSPVEMVNRPVFPVDNYGSGVTPFYTNLALWVGGFVLVAIYKLEVDTEHVGRIKPWQGFIGRWFLLNLFGQVQAIICCVGDVLLGIQCLSPIAFVVAGMVESFVYVFFIYAISVAFKHIGKALGVLLVVLQIPGASGTYPIEMMPGFFQALHPWLPFTYGISAMREAIAGFYGSTYGICLGVLLIYLIPAFLIGVTARKYLLNVNALFDRRLAESDLMITERESMHDTHFRLSTIIKVMMNSREYKLAFLESAAKFELMYPKLITRGFAALIWIPLVLLVLLFVLPHKLGLLICWIVSLIVICTFLIVVEYLHSRVQAKTSLADMDREQLYDLLDDELRQEFMAFAPIDKMRLDHHLLTRDDSQDNQSTTPPNQPASNTVLSYQSTGDIQATQDIPTDHEHTKGRDE